MEGVREALPVEGAGLEEEPVDLGVVEEVVDEAGLGKLALIAEDEEEYVTNCFTSLFVVLPRF